VAISSPGIGSNLDINGIVSQLMSVESQPLTDLNKKEASYQAKLSAYGSLNSALSNFQTALTSLSTPAKFQSITANAADSSVISGTANSNAVPGTYAVNVTKLAQAQTLATAGQTSITAPIGDGQPTTLFFQFGAISGGTLSNGKYVTDATASPQNPTFTQDGSQASGSVVIDSSNNSLQGIRDAINKANLGVTATIVSDGSATPYHLVITSNKTGETSSMKIGVTRDPAAPADTALSDLLAYDAAGTQNMTQSSAAQNTALTVNGIAITSTNTVINEAVQGVTLNVSKTGATTLSVARDTASVTAAVNSFVKAYNDLDKTIKTLTAYNPSTKQAGLLLGDSTVRNIQTQVRAMLGSAPAGMGGNLKMLSQIGVSFQKDGTLALDSSKLQTAMANNFKDIAGLFSSMGATTDSLIKFSDSTSATQPGSANINISALSTHGKATGTYPPVSMTIAAGVNDQLNLTVDGISASVTLAPNTYNSSSLAAQIQSAINGAPELSAAGVSVSVSADGAGILSITSNRYGSASNVSASGNAVANLFTQAQSTDGIDVAGTIDGVAATGSGQMLIGAKGSSYEGLKLEVTGGSTGDRGTINYSQGYAYLLNKLVGGFLGSTGLIANQTNGINSSIKDIGKSRDALNARLSDMEANYRKQFTALDATISGMNQTSTYLTQQLAQLANLTSK